MRKAKHFFVQKEQQKLRTSVFASQKHLKETQTIKAFILSLSQERSQRVSGSQDAKGHLQIQALLSCSGFGFGRQVGTIPVKTWW